MNNVNEQKSDRRRLNQVFLQTFPIERLENLTIEEYTNLNKEDSFCYWLETRTRELGSINGGTSFKFGIFKYDQTPKQGIPSHAYDDKYSWELKLGNSSSDAFEKVKSTLIKIAQLAQNAEWEEIEKIKELWPITIWKIAFLYSNEQLLPIYHQNKMLIPLATHFGLKKAEKCTRAELYRFLMNHKGNKDLYVFYDELLEILNLKKNESGPKTWLYAPGENASHPKTSGSDGIQ